MRRSVKRYLCPDCKKILEDSGLIFKKVPGSEGREKICAWCRRPRYGTTYTILYGRDKT